MRWFDRARVTLSVERDVARLLVVRGEEVTQWGSTPLPANAVHAERRGLIVKPAPVGAALRSLWQRHPAPTTGLLVTIPPDESSTRLVVLQPDTTVDEGVARDMAGGFWSLESSVLGWQVVQRNGRRLLFLFRTQRAAVEQMVAALSEANLTPAAIEPKPLALMRAAGRERCVIVDLERASLTVIVVDEALPGFVITWPLQAPLLDIPEAKMTRLAEAFLEALKRYNRERRGAPVDTAVPVVCTGALGDRPFLHEILESVLEYPVVESTLSPKGMHSSIRMPPDLPVQQYMANIGLAFKQAAH